MIESLFFSGWESVARTIILGALSYVAVVAVLRVSGKRTLSKLNVFDFVITIAYGSVLASMLTSKKTTLVQGALAFAVLTALQYIVAYFTVRIRAFEHLVKDTPSLLFYRGEWYRDRMRRERISEDELKAAARQSGLGGIEYIGAMVLETNGTVSVIGLEKLGDEAMLPERVADTD